MRKSLIILITSIMLLLPRFALAEEGAVPGVQDGNAYIPSGTTIAVELTSTVNSKETPRPGKDAQIPAGTKFIVAVDGNVDLQASPENLAEAVMAEEKRKGTGNISRTNWNGTYYTNRGKMTLHQQGNKVFGTYERNNGKISGYIKGDKVVGQWDEEKSDVAPSGKGFFEFSLSPGTQRIAVFWRNDYSNNWVEDVWALRITGW